MRGQRDNPWWESPNDQSREPETNQANKPRYHQWLFLLKQIG